MQTRTRLNIALTGGLVVIAGLFWLSGNESERAVPLIDLPPRAVTQMAVVVNGEARWRLESQPDGWRLTAPVEAPAKPERVNQMLQLLRAPISRRISVDEVSPARFGLDEPRFVIHANDRSVAVGDSHPTERMQYYRRGDEIVLASELLALQFGRDAESLIDDRLLPPGSAIGHIMYPNHQLGRGNDGRWQVQPGVAEFEDGDAERLARNWTQARAEQVLAWPPSDRVDRNRTITVTLRDGTRRHFYVLPGEGPLELACPETGVRYRMPEGSGQALMPPEAGDA